MFAALPVISCVWVGCAVTPENYRTWAMFFDGVPDPSTRPAVAGVDGSGSGAAFATTTFVHQPYADEQCDTCHKSELKFTRRNASGCVSCHEEVPNQHRHMHGPVAANACLWCHTPHESAVPHLLREADRALCARCHTPSLLGTERVPEHGDTSRACLECHMGHGGATRFMLRAESARTVASGPGEQ